MSLLPDFDTALKTFTESPSAPKLSALLIEAGASREDVGMVSQYLHDAAAGNEAEDEGGSWEDIGCMPPEDYEEAAEMQLKEIYEGLGL
jgi:hypothetical protein